MATAFRIHEDIENVIEQRKERQNVIAKATANGKEKRPTFAILNNVTFDGRNGAHAQRTVSSYTHITYVNVLSKYVRTFVHGGNYVF